MGTSKGVHDTQSPRVGYHYPPSRAAVCCTNIRVHFRSIFYFGNQKNQLLVYSFSQIVSVTCKGVLSLSDQRGVYAPRYIIHVSVTSFGTVCPCPRHQFVFGSRARDARASPRSCRRSLPLD